MTLPPHGLTGSALVAQRDLSFLLHEWLRVECLTERPRYAEHSREVFDDVLELAERIASERFAPHNRAADEQEPYLDEEGRVVLVDGVRDGLGAFFDAGLGGREPGRGHRRPAATARRLDGGLRVLPGRERGHRRLRAADHRRGEPAAGERLTGAGGALAEPMVNGRFFGTMCLSETAGRVLAGGHHDARRAAGRMAHTGCSARRCGSPAAITSSPRTSSTSCSRRSPAARRA